MKPRNILKQFNNGWIVGLSDHNNLLVETPQGQIGTPGLQVGQYQGQVLFLGSSHERIPDDVFAFVREKFYLLRSARQLGEDSEGIEDEESESPLTLAEQGFDDNPKVL